MKINENILTLLNSGKVRVAEKTKDGWKVNNDVKKAILSLFKNTVAKPTIFDGYDKLGLLEYDYENPRYRKVPGALIRDGVYIGDNAVIMPSYINIGAYIGEKTMIDINATIGSCAQIGKNCHIAASSVIGGVLEPENAMPVIIENNCFIGVHSSILDGCLVEEGCVIASGVSITSSTKIINRETGKVIYGKISAKSVVVPGSYTSKNGIHIQCAVIIKQADEITKSKTSINELLRDIDDR